MRKAYLKTVCSVSVFLLLACAAGSAGAQDIRAFRESLSVADTLWGARVNVTEHGTAAEVTAGHNTAGNRTVTGYRIRIFFDNSQDARENALAVQDSFRHQFPGIPSYFVYENPAFIVTVGNCLTIEEALILQNSLKNRFGTAFLWRGEIPLHEFVREEIPLPTSSDTENPDAGNEPADKG